MEEKQCTKNNNREKSTGIVYLVGGGPGDPGLLTLRGLDCLHKADVVVYDRLANDLLLNYAPQAQLIDVGKEPNHHPIPQEQINLLLIEQAHQGRIVVRLKGGDPFVFGRGGEEAQALAESGIRFEIVPGVTSAIAVPAYAGIPVTQRGVATSVTFVTGHCASRESLNINWRALAESDGTLVFLMGIQHLPQIVASLMDAGLAPKTPVALIEQGTLPGQKVAAGTLNNITDKASEIRPPAIIVIGEVVKLHSTLDWFKPEAEYSPHPIILDGK